MTEAKLRWSILEVSADQIENYSSVIENFRIFHSPEFDGAVTLQRQQFEQFPGTKGFREQWKHINDVPPIPPGKDVTVYLRNPSRNTVVLQIEHDPIPEFVEAHIE